MANDEASEIFLVRNWEIHHGGFNGKIIYKFCCGDFGNLEIVSRFFFPQADFDGFCSIQVVWLNLLEMQRWPAELRISQNLSKGNFRSLYFRIGEFSKHWHQQSLQRTVTAKKTWCKEDLMKRTGTAKNNHYNCRVIIVNIMLLIASIWWLIHYQ